MKELNSIFKPEISPIHKVDFSVAAQLKVTGVRAEGEVIPAGTILKGGFLADPKSNVAEIAKVADADAVTGVLMHDVEVKAQEALGETNYSVGVMIEGVVYEDVMALANGPANYDNAVKATLATLGIKTYGAKTIGVAK